MKKDGKERIGGYGLSDNAVRVAKLGQMGLQQEDRARALLQPVFGKSFSSSAQGFFLPFVNSVAMS